MAKDPLYQEDHFEEGAGFAYDPSVTVEDMREHWEGMKRAAIERAVREIDDEVLGAEIIIDEA